MIRRITLILLLCSLLFASSKFTLNGVSNVKIFLTHRADFIDTKLKNEIKNLAREKLEKEHFIFDKIDSTSFIIDIKAIQVQEIYILNITLMLGEDVQTNRDKNVRTFAYTYMENIFLESEFPKEETKDAVDFLICHFLDAYKDDQE